MPATDNPKKDREIFLKILTMDEAGLLKRKEKSIPPREIYEYLTPMKGIDTLKTRAHQRR